MKTIPLENFSFLQETSLIEQLGFNIDFPHHFFMQYSFNLHTPLIIDPKAYLTLQAIDADSPSDNSCFSITDLTRWRLDISSYRSFDAYLNESIRWHRCNYSKSKKNFYKYGCEISFIEKDWSEHAATVYQLYENVAKRYQHKLYDLSFFQNVAKQPDYKLLCAWFKGKMVTVFVLQEELPTLHSVCVGFDYEHSSPSYAYSWMHYALFEHAITSQKYQNIDVGFNSDDAKRTIGFKPIPSRIDIYSKGTVTRTVLNTLSNFIKATITEDAKLKFKWRS